ncbi:MAG TPA: ATP synthase subunit I [Terriglobales bacterium]|nr:ATP synthase subunit I [Terriglobales bacterium]
MTDVVANSDQSQSAGEQFFAAAYRRIVCILLALVPSVALLLWVFFNRKFALGFLIGGAIAIVNFLSLRKLVIAFADRVIASGGERRSSGLVLRFLLRYGLVGVAGYAIFKSSVMSAYGLLAGLAIPAIGIMIEAGYELYGSFRRGY